MAHDERLARLVEVGRSLVAELDLPKVLDRVLEVARELTGARYAALGILDESKEELEQFLTVGIDEDSRAEIGALPRGQGVLGMLISEPKPLRLEDVGSHPDSYGFPPGHPPMKTFLGVPVLVRGETWGNLYLTEKEGGPFTEEDEEALLVLADWAAIAIQNARLYQGVEQRRRELERAVRGLEATTEIARALAGETELDRVLELIVKRGRLLVEATAVVIMLIDGDELVVEATAGDIGSATGERIPIAGSLSGEVVLTGHAERVSDVQARLRKPAVVMEGATSALLVPLIFRGASHGVLTAFDRRVDGPEFTEEDERLMAGFGASAAAAVATARSVAEDRLRLSIEASEQERKRWARELHDDTLQGLAGLGVMLGSALRAKSEDGVRKGAEGAIEQIHEEVAKLRALIAELRPAALDEIGLRAAVEGLVESTAATQGLDISTEIALSSDAEGAPRLAPELESTAYRIVQEGLTNVAKHSSASAVEVRLVEVDGSLEVSVRDDGGGFEPSAPTAGFGLTGMRERVEMLGGTLALESSPAGLGTLVRASLPVRGPS